MVSGGHPWYPLSSGPFLKLGHTCHEQLFSTQVRLFVYTGVVMCGNSNATSAALGMCWSAGMAVFIVACTSHKHK